MSSPGTGFLTNYYDASGLDFETSFADYQDHPLMEMAWERASGGGGVQRVCFVSHTFSLSPTPQSYESLSPRGWVMRVSPGCSPLLPLPESTWFPPPSWRLGGGTGVTLDWPGPAPLLPFTFTPTSTRPGLGGTLQGPNLGTKGTAQG